MADREAQRVTDVELMAAVRGGDPSALGVLFDRHHARLFAFFMRLTGRRDVSEDLVQDTFLRILKYGAGFRGESSFAVWMYRVARNAFADRRRPREEPLDDGRADSGATPLELVERDEEADLLRRALLRLAPEKREVLVLCRFDGLRHEEVAELLGCSVGALKVRAHRALAELRDVYAALARERT